MTSNIHTSPILAIACGPIVTTWDISKHGSNGADEINSSSSTPIDATSILAPSTLSPSVSSSLSFTPRNNNVTSSSTRLSSLGIEQFQPFDYGLDGCTIRDVVWNHNGQGEFSTLVHHDLHMLIMQ